MKKHYYFLLLTLQLASCQNHKKEQSQTQEMNEQEYEWGVAVNTPIGYPIRFYATMVGGTPITRELYTKI